MPLDFVRSFVELPDDAVALAGGKGASLARMARSGLPVPPGFVVTSSAFDAVLEVSGLAPRIQALLGNLDVADSGALSAAADTAQQLVREAPLPPPVDGAVRRAYEELGSRSAVAVRSSAVAEDSETASFAGQQETFLNVDGGDNVVAKVRSCWASLFSARSLFYRAQKGAIADVRMAVVVQRMIAAEKSGVMFTMDPVTRDRNRIVVEAVFGLGEGIVSGALTPDHYLLNRDTGAVVEEMVTLQPVAIVCDPLGGTKELELDEDAGSRRVLQSGELDALRKMGLSLEACFGKPQDVEWCICGADVMVLQSRPITA